MQNNLTLVSCIQKEGQHKCIRISVQLTDTFARKKRDIEYKLVQKGTGEIHDNSMRLQVEYLT